MEKSYRGIPENSSRGTHAAAAAVLAREPGVSLVLDVPCGAGALAQRLADAGKRVVGSDCLPLWRAQRGAFVRCTLNAALPFATGVFDAVACVDGIAHVENPFLAAREFARVLRPGGVLVLSTPNISSLRSRWRHFLTGFHNKGKTPLDEGRPSPEHIVGALSFPQVRYLLHTCGFVIEAVAANRGKAAALAYAPIAPLSYLATRAVFERQERDPAQRRRNAEILRQLFSAAVLFGETLVVTARRRPG